MLSISKEKADDYAKERKVYYKFVIYSTKNFM